MRLVILLLLAPFAVSAQLTYYLRADTTQIVKNGGNGELVLLNGTRSVTGQLTNIGNGRTRFIDPRKSGDTLFIGVDTLLGFNSGQRFGVTGEDNNNSSGTRSMDMSMNTFILDSLGNYFLRSYRLADTTNINFSINNTTRTMSMQTGNARWQTFYKQNWSDITGSVVFIEANKTTSASNTAHIQLAGIDTSIQIAGERITLFLDTTHTTLEPNAGLFIASSQLKWSTGANLGGLYMDTLTGEVFRGPASAGGSGVTDHGALTGLPDDDHTQYALLAGRTGGQVLKGGDGTTDDLILQSTSGIGATGALIQFKVGNNGATTAMTVLNNGNVGIGNTNPSNLFHAAGNVGIGTTETTNYLLNLYATTATYFSLHNASSGTTSIDGFQFGLEPTGNYFIGREAIPTYFYTSNAQRMIIEAGGNVGIGDMSPASLLTVGASDAFQVNSSGKLARYAASAWTDGQILIGHTANGTAEKATPTNSSTVTWTLGAGALTANIPTSFITDGTYTPTLTNTTNISASVANANTGYYRVNNSVTVYGTFTVTPTAELTACEIGFSLPIASAIAASTEGGGAGSLKNTTANRSDVSIDMDATNDRATFSFMAPADTSPITLTFSFTYRVTPP